MNYPAQCPRVYVNPDGMISASGYYRASTTQELANMLPPWMHLRENKNSIGQQFISSTAIHLKRLETDLNSCMKNKFIDTAETDDVDVLYRAKLPSNVSLLDSSAERVRCIAAPPGSSPSGVNQIYLGEERDLKTFYYNCVPTRIEVEGSGYYTEDEIGRAWNASPSGVYDAQEKHIDIWKKKHDITWAAPSGSVRKQDSETMEDYEIYPESRYGIITDLDYYRGNLWCVSSSGSYDYLTILSSKTYSPNKSALDLIAAFDITGSFNEAPTKIVVKDSSTVYIKGTSENYSLKMHPRYDYFLLDSDNRYVYLREDYSESGVFISNT